MKGFLVKTGTCSSNVHGVSVFAIPNDKSHIADVDCNETFSPVVKSMTIPMYSTICSRYLIVRFAPLSNLY